MTCARAGSHPPECSSMVKTIDIRQFIEMAGPNPVIDVRSPAEYAYARIPGAVNIPLFSNEERAEVGTLYKQQGRDLAIKKGLELVGPKMRDIVEQAEALPFNDGLLVHCWRGGMRSASVGWLLQTYGLPVYVLARGYKGFRNHLLEELEKQRNLVVVSGPTGSGKTELLWELRKNGEQVLDLEDLAHHKGSVFGELGQTRQPSSEQFQNDVYWQLKAFDPKKPVWVEDESIGIGKVMIPDGLWTQMRKAPRVHFNMARPIRIKRLVREYGSFPREVLAERIRMIEKRLGGQHMKAALEALEAGDLTTVADILLVYYDKAYSNSTTRHSNELALVIDADHERFDVWAGQITDKLKQQYA